MESIKKIFHLVFIFSTAAFLLNISGPLSAEEQIEGEAGQSADEEFNYFMGMGDYVNVDVEVASMFDEDDLVVGSSVSRITPEMWRKMGARKITDALESQTAMVTYPAIFGFNTPAIRGYSREAIATKGVVTLVDGIPVLELVNGTNDAMPNFGIGSLKNIQLIKGPGSAIYGSDAFHGVISLNTFESDKDVYEVEAAGAYPLYGDGSLRISQGLGKYFRINASAGYNRQHDSEELEYDYNTTTGQPAAKGTGEYKNKYSTATGVLKLKITPSDKLKIHLGSYIVNNRADDFPGVKEVRFIQLNQYDHSGQDSTVYIYRGSAEYSLIKNISIEARGYYWYWDMFFTSNSFNNGDYVNFNVKEERGGGDVIIKQPDNAFNIQWLFAYSRSYSKVLKKVVRGYNSEGEPHASQQGDYTYMVYPDEGMNRTIDSLYSQIKWGMIKKRLFLLLGGRLDYYSDYGNQISPRGGLIFLPTERSSVKALYGRAFRAPSGNDIYGVEDYILGNPDLKPETIDEYELIYIYKGKDWRVTLNGFYSSWTNGIVIEPYTQNAAEAGVFAEFTNSGKNRAYGCEANLFLPFDPVAFELGGSYVKSTAIDLKTATSSKEKDYNFETFPEYIIIAGLHYTLKPAAVNFYLKNRVYLHMKETAQTDETGSLPPYWRMDLNISRTVADRLDLYLDIRNITNRKNYLPSLYYSMLSEEDGIPEAGTSVLVRAAYRI